MVNNFEIKYFVANLKSGESVGKVILLQPVISVATREYSLVLTSTSECLSTLEWTYFQPRLLVSGSSIHSGN